MLDNSEIDVELVGEVAYKCQLETWEAVMKIRTTAENQDLSLREAAEFLLGRLIQ